MRPGLDLLRLGVTLATTVLMARLLGVTTSEALMGLGLLVGLLLGVYEGLHLRVRFLGKGTFARRTVLGVAAWGVGVVVVQAAGVIGRIGLADFGLALSFLGIGQVVGLLAGRWQTVLSVRRAAAGAAAAGLVLLALAGRPAALARAPPPRPPTRWTCGPSMAGEVAGVAVEVRGNGNFIGAGAEPHLHQRDGRRGGGGGAGGPAVRPGERGHPDDDRRRGRDDHGARRTERGSGYTTEIQAFCGQYHDEIPSPEDVFTAGETGDRGTGDAGHPHQPGRGVYGRDQQEAIWQVTDGYDISANPAAEALVERRRGGSADRRPGGRRGRRPGEPALGLRDQPDGVRRPERGSVEVSSPSATTCRRGASRAPSSTCPSRPPPAACRTPTRSAWRWAPPSPSNAAWPASMPGCVLVHGGFAGGERSLTIDLLDLACDASFSGTQEMQDAVRAQLETGVLHLVLQDDTAVLAARLALNEGPPALPCGTSAEAAPVALPLPEASLVLSAGEGARTSFVGLGGAAALLLTALAGSGNTLGSAAAASRVRGAGGLRGAARAAGRAAGRHRSGWTRRRRSPGAGPGRRSERLPAGLRAAGARRSWRLASRRSRRRRCWRRCGRQWGRSTRPPTPPRCCAPTRRPPGLLGRLPAEVRSRLEEKVLAGLQEQQVAGPPRRRPGPCAATTPWTWCAGPSSAATAARCSRCWPRAGRRGRARVWPRAVAGLDLQAGRPGVPAPGARRGAPLRRPSIWTAYLDAGGGAAGPAAQGARRRPSSPGCPPACAPGARPPRREAGGRAGEPLGGQAARGGGSRRRRRGGSVLELARGRSACSGLLPPGLREQVGEAGGPASSTEQAVEKLGRRRRAAWSSRSGRSICCGPPWAWATATGPTPS